MKTKMILTGVLTLFQVKESDFQNVKWFLRYTQNVGKKRQTNRLLEKRYNFETNEDFQLKIPYDNLNIGNHIMLKFQIFIFRTDWDITRKNSVIVEPGRAWPGRVAQ